MDSSSTLALLLFPFFFLALSHAAIFDITNNCPYTLWAAAIPGGGHQLNQGQIWTINVASGTTQARIWARTGCKFDASGHGSCQTGDCGGVLACTAYGQSPNTLAEYALNQFSGQDYYDISVVDGFNVPMEFKATNGGCKDIGCIADIIGQCPPELKMDGGCNNACPVFELDEYCCSSGNCGPTNYSQFFKQRCPDAYSYPKDDPTSLFACPAGTNYKVTFTHPALNTASLTPSFIPHRRHSPLETIPQRPVLFSFGQTIPLSFPARTSLDQGCVASYSHPKTCFLCMGSETGQTAYI